MTSPDEFHVVAFACMPEDEPGVHLLSDAEYDRWCLCEPPQGYKQFLELFRFTAAHVSAETLDAVAKLCGDESTPAVQLEKWRAAGRTVLSQKYDDVCWMDVYTQMAGLLGIKWEPQMLPRALMLHNCQRFVDSLLKGCPYQTPPALPAVEAVLADYERAMNNGDIPNPEQGHEWLATAKHELAEFRSSHGQGPGPLAAADRPPHADPRTAD